jgi:hypothetical protein
MAYSEELANRVRGAIAAHPAYSERRMFGGICFMINGNMAVGVNDDDLMVRVAADDWDECLALPHARMMDFTGRPMRGWLFVGPEGELGDAEFAGWVERGLSHALTLPAKDPSAPAMGRGSSSRARKRS